MDRAFVGNFGNLAAKLLGDLAIDGNDALETVNPAATAALGFRTLFAVLGMDFGMRNVNADASEGQLLVVGILAQRYRGACAERDRQEVVGRWSGIEPAHVFRFIREQPMAASLNRVLKLAFARFHHAYMLDRLGALRRVGGEITREPSRDYLVRQRPRPQG